MIQAGIGPVTVLPNLMTWLRGSRLQASLFRSLRREPVRRCWQASKIAAQQFRLVRFFTACRRSFQASPTHYSATGYDENSNTSDSGFARRVAIWRWVQEIK